MPELIINAFTEGTLEIAAGAAVLRMLKAIRGGRRGPR